MGTTRAAAPTPAAATVKMLPGHHAGWGLDNSYVGGLIGSELLKDRIASSHGENVGDIPAENLDSDIVFCFLFGVPASICKLASGH